MNNGLRTTPSLERLVAEFARNPGISRVFAVPHGCICQGGKWPLSVQRIPGLGKIPRSADKRQRVGLDQGVPLLPAETPSVGVPANGGFEAAGLCALICSRFRGVDQRMA